MSFSAIAHPVDRTYALGITDLSHGRAGRADELEGIVQWGSAGRQWRLVESVLPVGVRGVQ